MRVGGVVRVEACPLCRPQGHDRLGEEVPGGSTGRKLVLDVEYEEPQPGLPIELFVKFSRDFDDAIRDRGRTQMDSEVRFAALTPRPGFPSLCRAFNSPTITAIPARVS